MGIEIRITWPDQSNAILSKLILTCVYAACMHTCQDWVPQNWNDFDECSWCTHCTHHRNVLQSPLDSKVVGNVQSWSWNNSGTGRQCGFPLKWPTKKKIPKKFNLQGYRPRKLALGGPIGLGPTQDPFWGLKLKIYYKKHIFGAFFVFMKNKFVSYFLDFVL